MKPPITKLRKLSQYIPSKDKCKCNVAKTSTKAMASQFSRNLETQAGGVLSNSLDPGRAKSTWLPTQITRGAGRHALDDRTSDHFIHNLERQYPGTMRCFQIELSLVVTDSGEMMRAGEAWPRHRHSSRDHSLGRRAAGERRDGESGRRAHGERSSIDWRRRRLW